MSKWQVTYIEDNKVKKLIVDADPELEKKLETLPSNRKILSDIFNDYSPEVINYTIAKAKANGVI